MIAWFLVPYASKVENGHGSRWCDIDRFSPDIFGSGGTWEEVEIAGDQAIVKVRASGQVIAQLRQEYQEFPKGQLNDALADLPPQAKAPLVDLVEQVRQLTGHNPPFADPSETTMGGVFRFLAGHRRKPRIHQGQVVCDGALVSCESVDALDTKVKDDAN